MSCLASRDEGIQASYCLNPSHMRLWPYRASSHPWRLNKFTCGLSSRSTTPSPSFRSKRKSPSWPSSLLSRSPPPPLPKSGLPAMSTSQGRTLRGRTRSAHLNETYSSSWAQSLAKREQLCMYTRVNYVLKSTQLFNPPPCPHEHTRDNNKAHLLYPVGDLEVAVIG